MNAPDTMIQLLQTVADLNERILNLTERMDHKPQSESLIYSIEEASRMLGISRSKLYDLLHRPDFPVIDIGHRKLIPRKNLEQWLEKQLAQ